MITITITINHIIHNNCNNIDIDITVTLTHTIHNTHNNNDVDIDININITVAVPISDVNCREPNYACRLHSMTGQSSSP
jgi:hypothetical protein